MIKFNEDCVSCKHKKVCKHVNKPKELKDKLKTEEAITKYGSSNIEFELKGEKGETI